MAEQPLIFTDCPGVYALGMQCNPGDLTPTFHAKFFPHQMSVIHPKPAALPAMLTVRVGMREYACTLIEQQTSIDLDGGYTQEGQYYPHALVTLQWSGFNTDLIFLSCSAQEYAIQKTKVNPDEVEVLWRDADVYCSNGWTVNDIIEEVARRANISLTSALPTLHVAQPTIRLQRGTKLLPFIRQLLPSGFTYLFQPVGDGIVLMLAPALTRSPDSWTAPSGVTRMAIREGKEPGATLINITGGDYKPGYTVILSKTPTEGSAAGVPATGIERIENLPDREEAIGEGTRVIRQSQTTAYGGDQSVFAIRRAKTATDAPMITATGALATRPVETVSESHEYDNNDVNVFLRPRRTKTTTTITGLRLDVNYGNVVSEDHMTWQAYSEGGVILSTKEAQDAPPSETSTPVLSATTTTAIVETREETWRYTSAADISAGWWEGSLREHTITRTRPYFKIAVTTAEKTCTLLMDATTPPQEFLQQCMGLLSQKGVSGNVFESLPAWTLTDVVVERLAETLERITDTTMVQRTITTRFQADTGDFVTTTTTNNLDTAQIPSQPSEYRTEPLRAIFDVTDKNQEGAQAGNTLVVGASGDIPTNNPQDFKVWASLLFRELTRPSVALSLSSPTTAYLPGQTINGCTILGCALSLDESGGTQVDMTAIA